MKLSRRTIALAVLVVVAAVGVGSLLRADDSPDKLSLDVYEKKIDQGKVKDVKIKDQSHSATGELADGTKYKVTFPADYTETLTKELRHGKTSSGGSIKIETDQEGQALWLSLLLNFAPIVLLIGVFLYFVSSMQGGGGKVMQFGKAKARQVNKDEPQVT